jgi:hypothetical protein
MNELNYPKVKILEILDEASGFFVLCRLDKVTFKNTKWIEDNRIGYLKRGHEFFEGRWHKSGENWSFTLKNKTDGANIKKNEIFECMEGYYGERAELVLSSLRWEEKVWDNKKSHDHCDICWEAIGGDGSYMKSSTNYSVCLNCYRTFVQTKNIDFVEKWTK